MSLHAQLSPEAQARFDKQRRNATISSVIIGLLGMTLLGVLLLIITMVLPSKEVPTIVTYSAGVDEQDTVEQKKVTTTTQRKPAAPSASMAKVIASTSTSAVAVPVPDVDVPEPSADFGDGSDFGAGWGSGDSGGGGDFASLPSTMAKRCSKQDRLNRLNSNGGNAKCEDAVVKALRFLKKTQNKDGSWGQKNHCGMTGLALLAYLGHCETASSEEFGVSVLDGISYLTNVSMKQNGRLADDLKDKHWPYEHGIAVYALGEAYTMCVTVFGENIPNLENEVKKAGQLLVDSQHASGGWDYSYDKTGKRGGDTSVSGWHLQALKAIYHTGLPFKNIKRTERAGLEYFERLQIPSGAIGYTKGKIHDDGTTLAAVGALCFQMWDKSAHSVPRKACRFIDKTMKFDWNTPDSDIYGHYYAAQAMINYGGEYWRRYNKLFRDQVLNNQNEDGSFKNVANNGSINAKGAQFKGTNKTAVHYRTCLATLMLEVYYRFLPATGQKGKS